MLGVKSLSSSTQNIIQNLCSALTGASIVKQKKLLKNAVGLLVNRPVLWIQGIRISLPSSFQPQKSTYLRLVEQMHFPGCIVIQNAMIKYPCKHIFPNAFRVAATLSLPSSTVNSKSCTLLGTP